MCIKNIYSFRKDEDLRPYDKQISINAIKKIGAPLLGLAKYIYYLSTGKKFQVLLFFHLSPVPSDK